MVTARFTDPDVGSRIEVKDEGSLSNMAGRLVRFLTWTPKVCRIIAFYRFWAIILPTLGGLGLEKGFMTQALGLCVAWGFRLLSGLGFGGSVAHQGSKTVGC